MRSRICILILILWSACVVARAQERVALVIGNSNYANAPLANPVNDAQLIATTLRQLEFDVIEQLDADENSMERAIQDFGDRLEDIGKNAVGLFYYAGHGVQLDGVNYLIPIGAQIDRERRIKSEAVSTSVVMDAFEYARNELNFLILDSCRDNPFASSSRSAHRGLASMDAPAGTLIAYATAPGKTSSDGDGENSPYSSALATAMRQKGVQVEEMLKNVARSVVAETGNQQRPWQTSSLIVEFYFVQEASDDDSEADELMSRADFERENRFWRGIQDSDRVEFFKEYLRQFPDGTFTDLARIRVTELHEDRLTVSEQGSEPRKQPIPVKVFDSSTAEIQTRNVATRVYEKRVGDKKWWDWSAYIEAAPAVIDHVVCVEYTLHKDFTPQVRTVCDRGSSARPYALNTNGWGTFKLRMRVIFDDGTSRQLVHQLSFRSSQD